MPPFKTKLQTIDLLVCVQSSLDIPTESIVKLSADPSVLNLPYLTAFVGGGSAEDAQSLCGCRADLDIVDRVGMA